MVCKLISWNIAGRTKKRNAQVEWIATEKPDILALQEVKKPDDLAEQLKSLGLEYFASTQPTEGREKLVVIASRNPLYVVPTFAVPHPERSISCRLILQGQDVQMHCVHVPPGASYGCIKIEFLEAITSGLAFRGGPQLLVGDFNCPQVANPDQIVTWAQTRGKNGVWRLRRKYRGIAGTRWDAAERSILCPKPDMVDTYAFLNGRAETHSYVTVAKGGGNRFDHIISSTSVMPSTIWFATDVLNAGLSDHAAVVAEWLP